MQILLKKINENCDIENYSMANKSFSIDYYQTLKEDSWPWLGKNLNNDNKWQKKSEKFASFVKKC